MIWLIINLVLLAIMGTYNVKFKAISPYKDLLSQINMKKLLDFVRWNLRPLKSRAKHVKIKRAEFIGSLRLKNENQGKKIEKARNFDCKPTKKCSFNILIDSF